MLAHLPGWNTGFEIVSHFRNWADGICRPLCDLDGFSLNNEGIFELWSIKKKDTFRLAIEDSVRLHDQYMSQLLSLLDSKTITLEGRECVVNAEVGRNELLVKVLAPTDNISEINLRMVYTNNVSKK